MNVIEHFFEQQALRTKEENDALNEAATALARLGRARTAEEIADLPPHLR